MTSSPSRIHMTGESELEPGRKYYQGKMEMKPNGLWYALDNDWLEWCSGEMPHWVQKYLFSFTVDLTNILILSNIEEVRKFCDEYEKPIFESITAVDWWKVSQEYAGIEICNYHKLKWEVFSSEHRLMSTWLYGWDGKGSILW